MLVAEWQVGQAIWTMLWLTIFFIWIWLLITVFVDIFRSHDMGGFAKFLWLLFVIFMPYLGVFVYLIARGGKMAQHAQQQAQKMDEMQRSYIRDTVATSSPADELERLADLKAKGVIDDAEFAKLKAKALGS
jgi:hypothetical protein